MRLQHTGWADAEPIGPGPEGFSGDGCRLHRRDSNSRRCAFPLEPINAVRQCDQPGQTNEAPGGEDVQQESLVLEEHFRCTPLAAGTEHQLGLAHPGAVAGHFAQASSVTSAAVKHNLIARPSRAAGPIRWRDGKTSARPITAHSARRARAHL